MTQLQDLQAALQSALAAPMEADCRQLCELMDDYLATLPEDRCLQTGGDAIALIAEVLFLKMQLYQSRSDADTSLQEDPYEGFPVLDDDDDCWERHTMHLDLESDEEDWGKSKKKRSRRAATDSVAAPVPPQRVLKMLQDLAGDEDPTGWSSAIAQWLKHRKIQEPISIAQIYQSMGKLTIVELWLGLLLGGYLMEQECTTEDNFYRELSEETVWLLPQ